MAKVLCIAKDSVNDGLLNVFWLLVMRTAAALPAGPNSTSVYPDIVDLSGYDIDGFRDVAIKAGWEEVRCLTYVYSQTRMYPCWWLVMPRMDSMVSRVTC